ncbi:NACHT, LRR and PYD domains-containing protein 2-like [Crocuta crocuta]
MAPVTEVSLHLKDAPDLKHASFCLKHCENLRGKGRVPGQRQCVKVRGSGCQAVSCSDTTQQWADFSLALEANRSLKCLDLTASELLDESARMLCTTLRHPKCFLEKLLENCRLTEACCKELSSALIVNQRLTHLCLANSNLGDGGVKLLCEGLSHPDCQLQNLVLSHSNITRRGCRRLSKLLQEDSSLTNLDLGLNPIATGSWYLCEALQKTNCNLRCLGHSEGLEKSARIADGLQQSGLQGDTASAGIQ